MFFLGSFFFFYSKSVLDLNSLTFFGGKCSLHLHKLPGTVRFETNCRMRSIFMDSINRKRRKTYPRKNNQQIFPFWIVCFELTIVGNTKHNIKKEKVEHNILKSLQPLFNQGLESYDLHNYSLIHMPIPSSFSLLNGCLGSFCAHCSWYPTQRFG